MGRNTEPFPADPRRFWFGNRGGDECLICGGQDSFYLLWFRLFFNSSMYLICWAPPSSVEVSQRLIKVWHGVCLMEHPSHLVPSEEPFICFDRELPGFSPLRLPKCVFWRALTKCVLFRLLLWNISHYYDRKNRNLLAQNYLLLIKEEMWFILLLVYYYC